MKSVNMMGLKSKETDHTNHLSIDSTLERRPAPDIPIDQLMSAVENTRPYVRARLLRLSRLDDIEDVMQDVRVAAWEGLVKQQYRLLPETTFGGWVQGIAVHLCADHIRRVLAHPWLPLISDPDGSMVSPVDFAATESMEQVAEHEWAEEIIAAVRKHVSAKKWNWAVECLTAPRQRHEAHSTGWDERKRWEAVSIVRQMAFTVKAALEVEPSTLCDSPTTIATAVCCLPSPLLQVVAERLVLTGVCEGERTDALMGLAEETGASWRYLESRIGPARRMYFAALEILERAAAGHTKEKVECEAFVFGSSALTS
ncbi:RNA polymerase sigma factor [Arthrobacter wenxiniae]|uniref:Sigma-70 family RNA polymerase sigma factor n=1 Tax=Arthrobacter wenxiniae TaxID=2713570 RepID=A0A7Y7IJP8_9MICC|nr:sigma-70 family RNA polymerase sigma factor [Arthrobacter wenxiniae]NVM96136.1 sigma-70 family RNA polymerase sigma factor [Arthrobacter wenxiniae]